MKKTTSWKDGFHGMRTRLLAAALVVLHTLLFVPGVCAQRFFNLSADDVRIDSVLPCFTYSIPLGPDYADSVYSVSIAYPEFIPMGRADVSRYLSITDSLPASMPRISQHVAVDRKKGFLEVSFVPIVMQDGKWLKLVSFMLDVKAEPAQSVGRKALRTRAETASSRYADHSVLATGNWAKIRVPETGVYQLTDDVIRKAGFNDLSRVRIYGYGGALQPEELTGEYLTETDDLKEVPTCLMGGRRLFHAQGTVTWASATAYTRTRNPYSNYGYYFITQMEGEPLTVDSATFVSSFYRSPDYYHALHEVDNYAWYEGGRKLYQNDPISAGQSKTYTLNTPGHSPTGRLMVAVSAASAASVSVSLNDSILGTINMSAVGEYEHGKENSAVYSVSNIGASNTISLSTSSSSSVVRLDYFAFTFSDAAPLESLTASNIPAPEYVYNITNQDHHADEARDMIIIVPLSQKLTKQAERIKAMHEERDGMTVRIVPADELYNEFSSGTPDASAYRRYMKMLYDRAEMESEMPKTLLLFGDCAWDNRMLSGAWSNYSPDDFLLCYESENSLSSVECYVSDDFFCLLDDGEMLHTGTSDVGYTGKPDIAVGRFPVRNESQAAIMVDKTLAYVENKNAGGWQNIVCFMGDDGNSNSHMDDANTAATLVESLNPGIVAKKIMWDAYTRESTSTGNTYPEVTKLIKQQQASGALVMDYCGHGRADQMSHELVVGLSDFENFTNENLPLWITASCDIMPFDSQTDNIGETAVLNSKGGAVAFFGTTRTVYQNRNKQINNAFLRNLFTPVDGQVISIGEAQRRAKNDLVDGTGGADRTKNKLQYSLLGDPALKLHIPTLSVVVDSIDGNPVSQSGLATLKAGSIARVSGHVEDKGVVSSDFNGALTAIVRDSRELITCKLNNTDTDGADVAFQYYDRTKTIFSGSDKVTNGRFSFQFAVPMDINYSDETGLINVYAVSSDNRQIANGSNGDFVMGGSDYVGNDSIGPSVYCYLNSPTFVNGGNVNSTPYFVAQITDKDGINTTGNGIGHDLQLIIDGDASRTYILNDNFQYDFGSYTSGTTSYSIPELSEGPHKLKFRAWDVLNNATTTELSFNVVKGLEPNCFSVSCTNNPATTQTTFIINHDRTGSLMDVEIDVFDFAGRLLWNHRESGVATSSAYTVSWDLTVDSGARLQTGVYLYRARVSSDGSSKASKAQKLIVIGNN